jgi:hypothetical protein
VGPAAVSLAGQSAELRDLADQAVAAERARIARELHDIVAHHLSVIVLQAAGARASGKPAEATLEKIERSARQALGETRLLLGVLHDTGEETGLAPQPGIGDLEALAASVQAAGLPVNLVISGERGALPAAVDVSVYRIVQEALTNVLKHAGPARPTCGSAAPRKRSRSRSPTTESGFRLPSPRPAATGWPGCASGRRYSAANWPPGRGPAAGTACAPGCRCATVSHQACRHDQRPDRR